MLGCVQNSISQARVTQSRPRVTTFRRRLSCFLRRQIQARSNAAVTQKCLSPVLRSRLGKLRVLSGREVCAILSRQQFLEVRRRGSHIMMQKRIEHSTITVAVPDHTEIRVGTLLSIIRQSQLPRSLFEN